MKKNQRLALSERSPGFEGVQRRMASAIMRRLTPDERTQPKDVDGRSTEVTVAEYIKPNDRLTSLERLEIYNRQYWFRLIDCLVDDFPGLRTVLGDGRFYPLVISYLESHPSTSPLLGELGKNLPTFIRSNKSLTAPHTGVAEDVARLEWAQIVAFDRGCRPPLNPALIASTSPDKLVFRLQPHITLLDLAYPVDAVVLRLLRKDRTLRNETSNAVSGAHKSRKTALAGRIHRARTRLLVHRHENAVYFKPLTRAQFFLLDKLAGGSTLAAACEALLDIWPKTKSAPVQSWFANWQHFGFLTKR